MQQITGYQTGEKLDLNTFVGHFWLAIWIAESFAQLLIRCNQMPIFLKNPRFSI